MNAASWVRAHPLTTIFVTALAARLAYLAWQVSVLGTAGVMSEDSITYLERAAILLQHGVMLRPDAGGGLVPATDMMPLYLWFLAAHHLLFTDPAIAAAVSQSVVDALTCLLIARLGAHFDRLLPGAGLWAGLLAAVNPTQIVVAGLILNETLFLHFCCASLVAALAWIARPDWRRAVVLGVTLALALHTRAMILPWVLGLPILLIAGLLICRALRARHFAPLALVVLIALAVQAPVAWRNYVQFDRFSLTSQGGAYVGLWLAPLVREAADGTPHAAGAAAINRQMAAIGPPTDNPFVRADRLVELGLAAMADAGPMAVVKAFGIGAAINLMAPAATMVPWVRSLPRTGFYDMPGETKLAKIAAFLFANDNSRYGWILLLGTVGVLVARGFQIRGLALALTGDRAGQVAVGILVCWVAFIILINGPIASPKYRQPAEAALIVFLALGLGARRNLSPPADSTP